MPVSVAVMGAGGRMGRTLSLLLKMSPYVSELFLYDEAHIPGLSEVSVDISHVDMKSKTRGFSGEAHLRTCLEGRDIVVLAGGVLKRHTEGEALHLANAQVVAGLAEAAARYCPNAFLAIMSYPIHLLVPVAAEVYRKSKAYDPRRIFGVTTLDAVRASTFAGFMKGLDPHALKVPCLGGHHGDLIVPLFSQTTPVVDFTHLEIEALTQMVRQASVKTSEGLPGERPALSMAYAGARFVLSLCKGFTGEPNVVECSFVATNFPGVKYFSSPLLLGRNGVEKILPLKKLSEYESELLKAALPELNRITEKGEKLAK